MRNRMAGRDAPRSGSLCGALSQAALSHRRPHRAGMASWTRPPSQNPPCGFPATGSPECIGSQRRHLDCRVHCTRIRQLEPCAAQQVAPVEPMTLTSTTQTANPLKLDLTAHPLKLALTVMQSEVLIE